MPSGGLDRGPRWLGLAAAGFFSCSFLFSLLPPVSPFLFSLAPSLCLSSFLSFLFPPFACFRVAIVCPLVGVWLSLCKLALSLNVDGTLGRRWVSIEWRLWAVKWGPSGPPVVLKMFSVQRQQQPTKPRLLARRRGQIEPHASPKTNHTLIHGLKGRSTAAAGGCHLSAMLCVCVCVCF